MILLLCELVYVCVLYCFCLFVHRLFVNHRGVVLFLCELVYVCVIYCLCLIVQARQHQETDCNVAYSESHVAYSTFTCRLLRSQRQQLPQHMCVCVSVVCVFVCVCVFMCLWVLSVCLVSVCMCVCLWVYDMCMSLCVCLCAA